MKRPRPVRQLRAAAALAAYDLESRRWEGAGGPVAEQLRLGQSRGLAFRLDDSFQPVRAKLQAPLAAVFRDRKEDRVNERNLAANILAEYAADRPDLLAELVMDADEKQFARAVPQGGGKLRAGRGVAKARRSGRS